jgi:hypothetical protein
MMMTSSGKMMSKRTNRQSKRSQSDITVHVGLMAIVERVVPIECVVILYHITQHPYVMMQWIKGEKSLPMKRIIIVGDLHTPKGQSGRDISPNAADTPLPPRFPPTMVAARLTLLLRRT